MYFLNNFLPVQQKTLGMKRLWGFGMMLLQDDAEFKAALNSRIVLILKPVVIRAGSLYDRFQGYLPGFVPRDSILGDTLGMGHTTPTATSVRKTRHISMLLCSTLMFYSLPMIPGCLRSQESVVHQMIFFFQLNFFSIDFFIFLCYHSYQTFTKLLTKNEVENNDVNRGPKI